MVLPYRELVVWQKAFRLAMDVLELADGPSFSDRRFYRSQMSAAAMSVPANIAEGNGRSTTLDYASFVDRARGSLFELDTWLCGAAEKGYLPPRRYAEDFAPRLEELSAMLLALGRKLRRSGTLSSR